MITVYIVFTGEEAECSDDPIDIEAIYLKEECTDHPVDIEAIYAKEDISIKKEPTEFSDVSY